MSDFFDDDTKEAAQEAVSEKITIGGQEFDPKVLEDLVEIGKATKEIEKKYNTKMERVYPEYIKTTQELKEARQAKQELDELKAQMAQQSSTGGGLSPEQIAQAREQLYAIMGGKPLTDKDADEWYQTRRNQEKAVEGLLSDVDRLRSAVEKDNKPVFDKKELLEYMDQTGITNPEAAYKVRYEKELDEWKMKTLNSGKRTGLFTVNNSSAGAKTPLDVRPNAENIDALIAEALGGNSDE